MWFYQFQLYRTTKGVVGLHYPNNVLPFLLVVRFLENRRLETLRLEKRRLETLRLETLRLETLRLETRRLETLRLETRRRDFNNLEVLRGIFIICNILF